MQTVLDLIFDRFFSRNQKADYDNRMLSVFKNTVVLGFISCFNKLSPVLFPYLGHVDD